MSTNETPSETRSAIEPIADNVAMYLDELADMVEQIDDLVSELDSMSDQPEDIEQFAEALRELDSDLHRHVKILREKMKVSFVSSDEHGRQA